MEKSPYDVLGVDKRATKEEIKQRYKDLAKIHHPDVGGDHKKFQEIQEAYEILNDEERRRKFDATGSVKREPSNEDKFKHFCIQVAMPIIQGNNENFDLVGSIKMEISQMIGRVQGMMDQTKAELRKLRLVQGRIKKDETNILTGMIQERIKHLIEHEKNLENDIDFLNYCIDKFGGVDYDFTPGFNQNQNKGWFTFKVDM